MMNEMPYPLRGQSPAICEARRKIEKAAQTDFPTLIVGESGVGKQAAAEQIHLLSKRAQAPFVEVNVSCWNNHSMLHGILFGYERGSFTGASQRHQGAFERAHRGAFFMDEIGELDMSIQPMLLKILDKGVIEPLGAAKPRQVDVRFIAATNRSLTDQVASGAFRLDLLARINCLEIRLPSLSERLEDLPLLWEGICRRRHLEARLTDCIYEKVSGGLPDNLRGLERLAIEQHVWG